MYDRVLPLSPGDWVFAYSRLSQTGSTWPIPFLPPLIGIVPV